MFLLLVTIGVGPAGRAIRAVRSIRESIAAEQRRNFEPYPRPCSSHGTRGRRPRVSGVSGGKRAKPWSATFVCIADRNQSYVPSSVELKEALVQAGLGVKSVEIDEEASEEEFRRELLRVFLKLEKAGGFELMRCLPNCRQLQPISFAVSRSPKLLRSVIGKSRIYIRPIQKSLDISSHEDTDDSNSLEVVNIVCNQIQIHYIVIRKDVVDAGYRKVSDLRRRNTYQES